MVAQFSRADSSRSLAGAVRREQLEVIGVVVALCRREKCGQGQHKIVADRNLVPSAYQMLAVLLPVFQEMCNVEFLLNMGETTTAAARV